MEKRPGPVPFILQEGKLRLWEETDLLKILKPARGKAPFSCVHAQRPCQAVSWRLCKYPCIEASL